MVPTNDSTQVLLVHSTSGDPQVACHLSQNVCHDSVKAIMKHMVDTISVSRLAFLFFYAK